MERQESGGEGAYLEMPGGIFSASGNWYHTNLDRLHAFAPDVLDRVPLPRLLGYADTWLRSSQTLTLWLVPVLLLLLAPLPASIAGLGIYFVWKIFSPAWVGTRLVKVFHVLENVIVQGLYYVFSLSVLAASGQMTAMWTGLAFFILLRWGLLDRLFTPAVRSIQRRIFPLPASDQVLRMLIVRTAMRYRLPLEELERMEQDLLRTFSGKKSKRRDAKGDA